MAADGSTPTTPSGKALLESFFDGFMPVNPEAVISDIEAEAFLAGLDSPETLEALTAFIQTGMIHVCHGCLTEFTTAPKAAESILASMRSSLRAETDR